MSKSGHGCMRLKHDCQRRIVISWTKTPTALGWEPTSTQALSYGVFSSTQCQWSSLIYEVSLIRKISLCQRPRYVCDKRRGSVKEWQVCCHVNWHQIYMYSCRTAGLLSFECLLYLHPESVDLVIFARIWTDTHKHLTTHTHPGIVIQEASSVEIAVLCH